MKWKQLSFIWKAFKGEDENGAFLFVIFSIVSLMASSVAKVLGKYAKSILHVHVSLRIIRQCNWNLAPYNCPRRVLAQNPRRHQSIPRVCTYKEFQKCMKCVRNEFVVWEAFSIWWNQACTVVSGNILATAQGGLVHHLVRECLWLWECYRQTGQKIEMATICVIFF